MDVNGVRLSGAVNHSGRYGARVVWHEGTLYVLRSPTDFFIFNDVPEPKKIGGGYRAQVGEKSLTIIRPGCSCRKDKALGTLTLDEIQAMATVAA